MTINNNNEHPHREITEYGQCVVHVERYCRTENLLLEPRMWDK